MPRKFVLFLLLAATCFAAPCPLRHPVAPADTLADLAGFYFGSRDFAPAILMATNSRTGEGFAYISNPDSLPKGSVCIPDAAEAGRSRNRYATYEKSVAAMAVARPWEVDDDALVTIPAGQPVTVVSWTRVGKFKAGATSAPGDTWVTVEPYLKEFCGKFLREHSGNREELTERLEQRLGLPPAAGYTTVARIRLDQPARESIFRPCSDPVVSEARCQAGPPSSTDTAYMAWFTGQYYSAYGLPRPNLYPWTSLGYTFDWAQRPNGEFQRVGESEFVIPDGTPINVLALVSTAEYCSN